MKIGVLAFGSLIDDPGEIAKRSKGSGINY